MYYKNMLLERSWTYVLKLDFMHLFSDSILKTPSKYKTMPFLKLVLKILVLVMPNLSDRRERYVPMTLVQTWNFLCSSANMWVFFPFSL